MTWTVCGGSLMQRFQQAIRDFAELLRMALEWSMARRREVGSFASEARRKLARAFADLPIFKRPRTVALYHYVTVLETEAIKAIFLPYEDSAASNMAHRRAVESSAFAIPGIYRHCPNLEVSLTGIDKGIFWEAYELFEFCYKYEQVDFSFKLADKGQFEIFLAKKEPRITFAYAEKSVDEAETTLRARELEALFSGERLSLDIDAQKEVFNALRDRMGPRIVCRGEKCEYTCGDDEFRLIRKLGEELVKSVPLEMDQDVAVGGITFAELHQYWGALLGVSNVHFMAHNLAARSDVSKWPLHTTVLLKSKREFIEWICRASSLATKAAETITAWYTYDPSVSDRNPILQPFLPLGGDRICLPLLFVNGNNFERNFIKLLHRHPTLIPFSNDVGAAKEPVALMDFERLFSKESYRTGSRIRIPGLTDADFIAYELASGFVLVIQHKWLTDPDTAEESWANDAKLSEGVRQGVKARDTFRLHPGLLRTPLGLSVSDLISQIEAVTVCRGLEPTGFLRNTAIPVISEVSFRGLLQQAKHLRGFWTALNSRPDRERAKGRVEDFKWTVKLVDYEFVLPGLSY